MRPGRETDGRRSVISRRALLSAGAGLAGIALLGTLAGCSLARREPLLSAGGATWFETPLKMPALAQSRVEAGVRVFDLELQAGRTPLVAGGSAATWGVNGSFLGPTLRVANGEAVRMDVRNALPETSNLHWHGMHLPARADGGPRQPIEPGGSWSPAWTVDQPAATLWYHPHPHGATERHVYLGVAGLLIVDDEHEAGLALPRHYGVDDIPLILQDKTFTAEGALVEGERSAAGMLGDTILVNGTHAPVLTLSAERTRLRLVNGSTARSYALGFDDDRAFTLIAGDGGLLDAPVELRRILLTPGERAEIVVTVAPGDDAMLRSFPHDLGLSERASIDAGAADELDILLLRAEASLTSSPELPTRLATVPPTEQGAFLERSFELRNDRINGEKMDPQRVDLDVAAGTAEIWEIVNTDNAPHNFHVHGVQFRVVDVGGLTPAPELRGLKDTVYVPPNVPVRLALRFGDHADPEVPYMYHCHLLQHEDRGMMGQFVVLGPGQRRVPLPPLGAVSGHDH